MKRLVLFIASVLLISAGSYAQNWRVPSAQNFEQTMICLGDLEQPLTVELADKPAQHARGLMQRESLGEFSGMLFRYPEVRNGETGFWMYQTLIPLDIAYLNEQQEIVKTFTMLPCGSDNPSKCRSYAPGKPYQFALEMNAGFFAEHDIRMGDKVNIVGQQEAESNCHDIVQ
ncbi:MAG: DUF192 domain-containing protein [Pseudomonadota bacterium]